MAHLVWQESLNTGIDAIDEQHRRIVEYINQLHDARMTRNRAAIAEVIVATVDYTVSHFDFEEALMEGAGYEFVRAHKRVHEIFIKRVTEFRKRFDAREEIAEELHGLLSRWLIGHIRNEDSGYVKAVRGPMQALSEKKKDGGWLSRSLGQFFGR
jgi:hemerythrin